MKKLLLFAASVALLLPLSAQTLNIGSYNIRQLNDKDIKHNDSWEQRRDMVCGVIRTADYDIFGSQEATYPQIQDMLKGLEVYDYIGVGRDDGLQKGEYSPIFYKRDRLTLLDSGNFWFSETPTVPSKGWDAKFKRICTWGYFKDRKTKAKFYFFSLHMDHRGVVARAESAKMLVEKVRNISGGKGNYIIVGDFNVHQQSEPYRILHDCGLMQDSYETAAFRFAPTGTFNGWKADNYATRRIDHVFVSNSAKIERYSILTFHYWLDKTGEISKLDAAPKEIFSESREVHLPSDHYPVQVILKFPK